MKPGDHPEFFRLSPPPGRSRESTIVLDRFGRFSHDGDPVEHQGLARGLARWIRRHPDTGRYILENGYDWCYLTVEATPFFVDAVVKRPEGPVLRLTDGSEVPLDPAGVTIDDDGVLRAPVRGDHARFTRAAQLQMVDYLDDGPTLVIAGGRYPLHPTGAP